jgi:hypothetical protein
MYLHAAGAPGMAVRVAFGTTVMAVILGLNVWYCRAAGRTVDQWAVRQGLRLLDRRFGWFSTGPFPWVRVRGGTHFRIVAEDAGGCVRRGWVRLADHRVEARWDVATDPATSFPVVPTASGGHNDER